MVGIWAVSLFGIADFVADRKLWEDEDEVVVVVASAAAAAASSS